MAATLDMKYPTIVAVGRWNSAILSDPKWVAKNILKKSEGEDLTIRTVLSGDEVAPGQIVPRKTILLFEEFGLCCSEQRLELYADVAANAPALYRILDGVSKALPHTPVRAVGVNFHYTADESEVGMGRHLDADRATDEIGRILAANRTDVIEIPDSALLPMAGTGNGRTTLKLARSSDFSTAEIDFNYDLPVADMALLPTWSRADPVAHWHAHSRSVMKNYGFDEVKNIYYHSS